ncbi:MAG TPA: peptidylprolyl isomerase [Candidatus Limnocylindrales bacterium]
MILAFTKSPARRLATVGLVAVMFAGCSTPAVTASPSPSALPTVPPTAPAYTLGPTMSPSGAADACPTSTPPAFSGKATVTMTTNFGDIVIAVDGSLGANAAGAFMALTRCGYYNNVIFHRVIPGFVVQAGDGTNARLPEAKLNCDMGSGGPSWTIQDDKVTSTYKRGTISMARTSAANSGSSQFFIVLTDSASSVLGASTANNYAIFGDVTKGMDVVDAIAAVPTGGDPCNGSTSEASIPLEPIVITSTIVS